MYIFRLCCLTKMDVFLQHRGKNMTSPTQRVLNHRLNQNLITNATEGFVSWKRKDGKVIPYPGVTRAIKKRFVPDKYEIPKGTSSVSLGNRIHKQLCHWIECDNKCTCGFGKRKYNKLVLNAQKILAKLQLRPIAAELPIISHTLRFATRIDMICFDLQKKVEVIVSIKTGDRLKWINGIYFKPPFDSTPCNPHNIAQLQSVAELAILKEYDVEFADYFIFYLSERSRLVRLDQWAFDSVDKFRTAFSK